ncbi:DUF362 domain-containing protein [Candidatus Bathyarchaeota archaeon]|nr:DUF362 domain-containing protein [Candidatus Bathyarchaeota archaeon]
MVKVVIAKGENIKFRTKKSLEDIGGVNKVVGKGDKVFIKPNIVDGAPFITGEVVQLETIEVLVKESFNAGASEVLIGETPTYRKPTETIISYMRLAKETGAKFLELNNYPFTEVNVENPCFFNKVRLSSLLLESDVFINVPTLKTHLSCGVTLAIKNMYGLISPEDRILYHSINRVEEAIVDLYKARRADLIVVDGTYTTLHLGARPLEDFKETFRLNLTIAGFDPVAVETISAKILGVDPSSLRYLKWAEEDGLGTMDLNRIEILGVPFEEAYFGKAVDIVKYINNRMENLRIINFGACTGCLQMPTSIMRMSRILQSASKDKRIICVIGPKIKVDELKKSLRGNEIIILCGYCAAPTFYNELDGHFVPGCPPQPEDLQRKIREALKL